MSSSHHDGNKKVDSDDEHFYDCCELPSNSATNCKQPSESPKSGLKRLCRKLDQCQEADNSAQELNFESQNHTTELAGKADAAVYENVDRLEKVKLDEGRPNCEDVVSAVLEETRSSETQSDAALRQFLSQNADAADDENAAFVLAKEPGGKSTGDDEKIIDDEAGRMEREALLTVKQKEALRSQSIALKSEGNQFFGTGDFGRAIEMYEKALATCPLEYKKDRSVFHCNKAAAEMKMENWAEAAADCDRALELDPSQFKAVYRRACCYERIEDKWDQALVDFQEVLKQDPRNEKARAALIRLPPMIDERNEKMKAEMMGKLKDLGDMVLRPFGLSTDNFELQQNDTGGYSIKMK